MYQENLNPLDRLIKSHFDKPTILPENLNSHKSVVQEKALKTMLGLKVSSHAKEVEPQFFDSSSSITIENNNPKNSKARDLDIKNNLPVSNISSSSNPSTKSDQQPQPNITNQNQKRKTKSNKTASKSKDNQMIPIPAFFAGSACLNSPDPNAVPLPDFDENFWDDDNDDNTTEEIDSDSNESYSNNSPPNITELNEKLIEVNKTNSLKSFLKLNK